MRYIDAISQIEEIREKREEMLNKVADLVAGILIGMNKDGASNKKAIESDVNKLLNGFGTEEKESILLRVCVKLTMNL